MCWYTGPEMEDGLSFSGTDIIFPVPGSSVGAGTQQALHSGLQVWGGAMQDQGSVREWM